MPAKLVLIYYILWCLCRIGTIFVELTKQSPVRQKNPCSMHRILQGTKNFRVTTPIPAYRTLPIRGHSLLRNVQPTSRTTLPHKSDILRPIRQFTRAAPVRNSPPNLNLRKLPADDFLSLKGYWALLNTFIAFHLCVILAQDRAQCKSIFIFRRSLPPCNKT